MDVCNGGSDCKNRTKSVQTEYHRDAEHVQQDVYEGGMEKIK